MKNKGLRTVVYPAPDLKEAKRWYAEVLGQAPYFDEPFYVGFEVAGYELGLQPDAKPAADPGTGAIAYWGVDDIEAELARLLELGAREHSAIQDVGGGIRVASVLDPFGNAFGVIYNPNFEAKP